MTRDEFKKHGWAELAAFGRQGLGELAQCLPAFNDGIKPVEEPGGFGNPVSRELYEQKHPSFDQVAEKQSQRVQEPDVGMEMS